MKKKPLYPFLFSIFPVVSLAASNIGQIFPGEIIRPLIFSLLLSFAVYGSAYVVLRDTNRAALVTVALLFLFFSYGQIYSAFEGSDVLGLSLFRHRILFPLFLILGFACILWMPRIKQPPTLVYSLNMVSLFLLIYPSLTIAASLIRQSLADSESKRETLAQPENSASTQPDVYYIILDGYGRQDVLLNEFGYDNSDFIAELQVRGFYVAECSQSNYAHTLYSLSSSLNYDYHDALGATEDSERISLLKHGALRAEFESLGYSIVAFPTGWSMTEWTDADVYPDYGQSFTTLTEFETLFLDTTVLRVATDYDRLNSETTAYSNARRLRVLSMIETLKEIPSREGSYFVFAHFVIPHPPYSFGANGEWLEINVNTASYDEIAHAYLNQVEYISGEILSIMDVIQSESNVPPIIIVQGDHGPPPDLTNDPAIRMPILNAYFLPGVDADQALYPSISPVNSFRVVLNRYFGATLPLLEDRSYFAPNQDHARLGLVSNSCP